MEKSPFQHIKEPLKLIKSDNVKVAFKDNASAMGIESVDYMVIDNPSERQLSRKYNISSNINSRNT